MLLLFFAASPVLAAQKIVAVTIEKEGPRVSSAQIRNILPFREGDDYEEKKWEASLNLLKKWGQFSEILLTKKAMPQGLILHLKLSEGFMISRIRISGNYPYLSKTLHRFLAIHPGDFFDPVIAEEQKERLHGFYEREGYFETVVGLEIHKNVGDYTTELHYKIDKGKRYPWGSIQVEGGSQFPRGRYISAINPLLPYKPSRLRKAKQKLLDDYRRRDYLQTSIHGTLERDDAGKKMNLVLHVKEAQRTKITILGNRRISKRTLKKILPIAQRADVSWFGIEEALSILQDYYRERGFQEVKIEARKKRIGPDLHEILFEIQEGPQMRIKKIAIEGNRLLSDRKIRKQFSLKESGLLQDGFFQPSLLEKDLARIKEIYRFYGFPDASLVDHTLTFSPHKDKVIVGFDVDEGPRLFLQSISFTGNKNVSSKKLARLLKMRAGSPLEQERLERDLSKLINFYQDRGFPHVRIQPSLVREEGSGTDLIYQIEEGTHVVVGEILLAGNQRTRQSPILKAMDLKQAHSYSFKKLLQSESSLRQLGTFRAVEVEPFGLERREERTDLVVKLEESPVSFLDLESSFDTDDKFTGSAVFQHNNLWGYTKRVSLRMTGGQDIQKGELNFTDPRLLGFNLETTMSGLLQSEQRPGFDATEAGGQLSLLQQINPQMTLLGKYQATRTFFQNVADPNEQSQRDNTISKVGLSFNYDTRDSFSDPLSGYTLLCGLDVSNKLIASGFNFLRPLASTAFYHSWSPRLTLLNYLRIEGIQVFGDDILTRNLRLFLGGDYSMRGFGQDLAGPLDANGTPTGGQFLIQHTLELQTEIKNNFKTAVFLDTGSLTNNVAEIGLDSWRHSAGLGLRYITPIGPLRLDYGFKLDKRDSESLSRLHFAFGYSF